MPELPEVETVRRGLEPFMAGKVLEDIVTHRAGLRVPFPEDISVRLAGRRISKLTRRAKYLLIHFDEDILVVHLGMSGRMTIIEKAGDYKPQKHDHMVIRMRGGAVIAFNDPRRFGIVLLMKESELPQHATFQSLGPEPLPEEFDGKMLHAAIKNKKTPIKLALLDQRVVAGIGNIYACEALYESGIRPDLPCTSINAKQAAVLAKTIRAVLLRAIDAGGSSLKDYRKADGSLGYFQHNFKTYDRAGEACPKAAVGGRKKHIIQKITQGGRSTFYCPDCQA